MPYSIESGISLSVFQATCQQPAITVKLIIIKMKTPKILFLCATILCISSALADAQVVITPDDDGYYGVTVEYVNVNLRENKGSYIVTIDEFEPIPIENTSENRPYLVAPFEG